MNTGELQQQLFAEIKRKIGEDASMVDEVAKLLDISTDSAYRRIRGEKTISLDELHLLCTNYKISLDRMMDIQTSAFVFHGNLLDKKNFRFDAYITDIMHNMAYMNSFKEKRFFYMCKDLPFFYHYHFREIAAFKWFFWLKTYFQFPEFAKKKFNFSDYPDELFVMDQKVLTLYNQIPSVEVWNIENMNIFFRQIEFYRDGEVFESDKDVYILYEAIEKLWDHLEKQAALGYKFDYNDPQQKPLSEYKMYFNEVSLGDNSMLVMLDDVKRSYIIHSTINYISTTDTRFNENMYNYIQNQMQRSTLISEVSEKERARFFHRIRERIAQRKEALKV